MNYLWNGSAIDPTLIEKENWAFYNSFSNLNFKNRNGDKKIIKNKKNSSMYCVNTC